MCRHAKPTISIKIDGKIICTIRRDLLCAHSLYFKSRVENDKAQHAIVSLDGANPDTILSFISWLLAFSRGTLGSWVWTKYEPLKKAPYWRLCRHFVFAESARAVVYQNWCMDNLFKKISSSASLPSSKTIQYVWESTTGLSPLRRAFVLMFARYANLDSLFLNKERTVAPETAARYNNTFLAEVIVALYGYKFSQPDWSQKEQDFREERNIYFVTDYDYLSVGQGDRDSTGFQDSSSSCECS